MREPPYPTELKPYGRALVDLARRRGEVLCLSGDLTKQTEVDLFQAELPERFIHGGMAEANMMGMAGALARCGYIPFVHTFGVFATRRPFDQIANAIAYPNLPVRIVGFMPGISTPGGPSHQAIDDVALMRALPNMTVMDVADAVETRQVVKAIADVRGPVYLRLKRGEIPVIFDDDHVLRPGRGRTRPAAAPDRASGYLRRRIAHRPVSVRQVRPVHQDAHRDDLVGARQAQPGTRRADRRRGDR
jgi:transketolase